MRNTPCPKSTGFTIVELLVVTTILAIVAGAIIFSQGDTQKQSGLGIALYEMSEIKSAISRFKIDVGSLPSPANPADFSDLYQQKTQASWNVDVARGWRGPYLSAKGEGLVDIGDNLKNDGTGSPAAIDSSAHSEIRSVADPFIGAPVRTDSDYQRCGSADTDNNCLLDWRVVAGDTTHDKWGRPYLLFEFDQMTQARIVSMGPNRRYESAACSGLSCNQCSPGGDDLVLCIGH